MRDAIGVIIDKAKARTLVPGWETEILLHGDIFNRLDVLLMDMDVKRIHDILDSGGEIEFRCWSKVPGASEAFMKTLEQPREMACETHGVPGCRQRGCEIWLPEPSH